MKNLEFKKNRESQKESKILDLKFRITRYPADKKNRNFDTQTVKRKPMPTINIKKRIHSYVDQADDRILKMIYAMLKSYQETEEQEGLSKAHKEILDQRLSLHAKNPKQGSSLKEVKNRLKKNYDL